MPGSAGFSFVDLIVDGQRLLGFFLSTSLSTASVRWTFFFVNLVVNGQRPLGFLLNLIVDCQHPLDLLPASTGLVFL